ncbi:hypothetical protein NW768_007301 [Fusarium equiseti]|uniref:Heterokaryon incompatibility domain-containing protein n=1 Tax=Fusarium equiseti TaxID=61235 RepID=A0ABQ8RAM4_FUSEQ|nr:hypothetical protein NW768_007301 [Fusarium equiseti]
MELPDRQQCHIFVVAPAKEDFETAELLLHDIYHQFSLKASGAICTVGRIGPHQVILAGNGKDIPNIVSFTNDTVSEILEEYPSIKAGFLIGSGGTAPATGIAKIGDVVVGTPQGLEPGVVQFDASQTTQLNRLSVTHQMSKPPSSVTSVVESLRSWQGRREFQEELFTRAMYVYGAATEKENLNWSNSVKVLHGKIASCESEFPRYEVLNRAGNDSKVLCFERTAAKLNFQLPILTICEVTCNSSSSENNSKQKAGTAAVIYTLLVASKIDRFQLEKQHAFADLFSYEPFELERPGFRLIQLHQGTQPPMRCSLFQAYLDEEESMMPYESLSYVWGNQNTPCEIMVNKKVLSITISLYDALCHLRQPHEDRILWVDALCIDQSNIKERSHQVNHMGEIYRKSENVIVWLGYLSGNAADLKTAVDHFALQLPSEAFRKWPCDDQRWRDQWQRAQKSLGMTDNNKLLDGLEIFMSNPWFTRVWVLQEVANAKRAVVECNLGKIPAKLFALLPHIIGSPVSEQCQAVLEIMPGPLRTTSWWSQDRNLCTLLCKFKGSEAADPRDRVYALLGMASDVEISAIEADYAKEERIIVQELCMHFYGRQNPMNTFTTTSIRELQSQISTISAQIFTEKLGQHVTTDCLMQFLRRQGMMKDVSNTVFHKILDHGSLLTNAYLEKCEVSILVNLDVAERTLSAFPDVFDVLKQRQHISPALMRNIASWMVKNNDHNFQLFLEGIALPIDPGPELITQLLSYGPIDPMPLLKAAFKAFNEPMQLDERNFLRAIDKGKATLNLILQNCRYPIVIPKKVLAKAASTDIETLQIIFQTPRNALHIEEEAFAAAASQGLETVQFLLDNCDGSILSSRRLLRDTIGMGTKTLEQVLKMSPDSPNIINGNLLIVAAKRGPKTLQILLHHCYDPQHAVSQAIQIALIHDPCTLSTLLELCPYRPELDENLFARAIARDLATFRLLFQHCIRPINLTEKMLGLAIKAGIPILEVIFDNWATDIETTELITKQAAMAGIQALENLIASSRSKIQITDNILQQARAVESSYHKLAELRRSETDVKEHEAIAAIESGVQGFMELLNRPGVNFKLTEKISMVASKHDYAFRLLQKKRPSELFMFRRQLFCQGSASLENEADRILKQRGFEGWENISALSEMVQR